MLQERKPRVCGIFAIFFQSETQVLMTVSDFWVFFLGIISWKVVLLFNGEGFGFQLSVDSILRGVVPHWRHWLWWEGRFLKNIIGWRVQPHAHYGKSWYTCTTSFKLINIDIMEYFVVMECIYNVDACRIPAFLCYIANKLFGQ